MRPRRVQILAVVLISGLVLAIIGSGICVVAVRAGIAPPQRPAAELHHHPEPPTARLFLARPRAP